MALSNVRPVLCPNASSKSPPNRLVIASKTTGCPPNLYTRCRTLYAAPNPTPGNRLANFEPTPSAALVRKIAALSADADRDGDPRCNTRVSVDMRRLATVSTGWKRASSETPATAEPTIRAVDLPDIICAGLVAEAAAAGFFFFSSELLGDMFVLPLSRVKVSFGQPFSFAELWCGFCIKR